MLETLHFEFGEMQIFERFVVVEMKEGITVKPIYNNDLVDVSKKYFKDKTFGYITCRKNSYSVDPLIYLETSEIKNLVAFAVVVSTDGLKITNLEIEKIFLKKPLRHFKELQNAKNWVNEIIENPQGYISD